MKPIQSFNESLEQYMLKVAGNVIDLVGEKAKSDLIKFFLKIGDSPHEQISDPSLNATDQPHTSSGLENDTAVADTSLLDSNDQQQTLKQSAIDRRDSRVALLQDLLRRRQEQINSIMDSIARMGSLIERAKQLTRGSRLSHYQAVQKRLITYLTTLQQDQHNERLRVAQIINEAR